MVKIAIAFLLAFFPLHQTDAQNAAVDKTKTLRIKMLKEVDGKVQVMDTTVQAADHAGLLQAVKGINADTAMLRRLQSGLSSAAKFDASATMADKRVIVLGSKRDKADTTVFRNLHGGRVSVYLSDAGMRAADKGAMFERERPHTLNTIWARSIKGSSISYHKTDSAMQIHRLEPARVEDVVKFRTVNPNVLFGTAKDSAGNVIRLRGGSETLSAIAPKDIRSIIVYKNSSAISIDSLISPGENSIQLKVIKDEKTGEKKVYRIDESGEEAEVKADCLKLDHGNARVMIFLKATVEDIKPEDKRVLKEAGAAVETKKKEELNVEKISFYPNPNNGRFNLKFALEDEGTTRVSVMDRNGEEVFVDTVEQLSGEYNRQIDLTPFGRGIYYLQIAQGKKYQTKKILVQ